MPSFLWRRNETRVTKLLLSPLLALEGGYRVGALLHRWVYDVALRRRVRVPLRVVSVGNLTVGGSGKTPVAAWLAREIRRRGLKIALLSRGFRGRQSSGVNVVSDGKRVLLSPADVGDEAVWLAQRARGVPVLAGRNRPALALRARALFGAEIVLLDDGFQHHRLQRDLDLVCLDARLGLGNGHVLPRGPLRESQRVLRRADAFLWTRAPEGWRLEESLPATLRIGPNTVVPFVPTSLRDLATGRTDPLSILKGTRVGLLAALARPDRLEEDLARLGANVAARQLFPDHHLYRKRDFADLDSTLSWITTGKDAVKIPPAWVRGRSVLVLEEEVRPVEGARLVDWILQRLHLGGRG